LFVNGISQSGAASAMWAQQRNPKANANAFGEYLKCPTTSSQELIDCIKTKSISEIILAQFIFKVRNYL
jgi:hypothetical protein